MTGLPPSVQAAYERLLATPPLATADLGVLSLPEALEEGHLPEILFRPSPLHPDAERVLLLFAADCAEMVLPVFEAAQPGDDRPRRAIEATRRYALGSATAEELVAAREAADDASNGALSTAAGDAAAAAVVSDALAAVMSAAWAVAHEDALTDNEAWEALKAAWEACAQLLLRYHRAESSAGGAA